MSNESYYYFVECIDENTIDITPVLQTNLGDTRRYTKVSEYIYETTYVEYTDNFTLIHRDIYDFSDADNDRLTYTWELTYIWINPDYRYGDELTGGMCGPMEFEREAHPLK